MRIPVGRHSTGMDTRWLDSGLWRTVVGLGGSVVGAGALWWVLTLDVEGLRQAFARLLGSAPNVHEGDLMFVQAGVGFLAVLVLAFALAALAASWERWREDRKR